MDATTDTDTNIYLAYGRPVTRQRWVESIAADWLAVSGDYDINEVARLLRTWDAADLAAQCAAGWTDEDDAPTVAELTTALAALRDMYAAAEAAAMITTALDAVDWSELEDRLETDNEEWCRHA